MAKKIGVSQNGEFWSVCYPSSGTRDGTRTISLPGEAFDVLRAHFVTPQAGSRKQAVLEVLKGRNGQPMSLSSLVSHSLEALGQDSENMTYRRQMCGLISDLSETGDIQKSLDGRKEQYTLPRKE